MLKMACEEKLNPPSLISITSVIKLYLSMSKFESLSMDLHLTMVTLMDMVT